MEHILAIQTLIDILLETKTKIAGIENLPEAFKTRADRTITILANSSAHTIGQTVEDIQGEAPIVFGPVTNFMGKEINVSEPQAQAKKVDPNAVEAYRAKINSIIETMGEFTPKQFYDKYTESEIRAVAKVLKMGVTTTDPAVISLEFMHQVYEAHSRKLKEDALEAEVESAKDEMKESEEETLTEDEERAVLVQRLIEVIRLRSTTAEIEFNEVLADEIREKYKETPLDEIKKVIEYTQTANVTPPVTAPELPKTEKAEAKPKTPTKSATRK